MNKVLAVKVWFYCTYNRPKYQPGHAFVVYQSGTLVVRGFQAKEAKAQLSLWSEPVLKGINQMFARAGHGQASLKTHMRIKCHKR